jgi:hypothetical protein
MREVYLTPEDVIAELKSRQGLRTQQEFAETDLGITQGHLANIYSGNRKAPSNVIAFLGLIDAGQLYRRREKK